MLEVCFKGLTLILQNYNFFQVILKWYICKNITPYKILLDQACLRNLSQRCNDTKKIFSGLRETKPESFIGL